MGVSRNSLAVQWLGLGTFTARARILSLVRELRTLKLRSAAGKKKRKKREESGSVCTKIRIQ